MVSEKTVQPRIVVGFSHSPAAAVALRWALREASVRGAVVEPVHAWESPIRASYAPSRSREEEYEAAARRARRAIHRMAPRLAPLVLPGPAAQVLLGRAEEADLLVLGGRARGADAFGPVGPVVSACLALARCPVVVVPPPAGPARLREPAHDPALAGIPPLPA